MIIYKTTNLINEKIYIGQDSRNNQDYLGSGVLINRAIKKYGKENFKKEVICECSSKGELNKKEIYWIKTLKSRDSKIGYNLTDGGDGLTNPSVETRKKISELTKIGMNKPGIKEKLKKPRNYEYKIKVSKSLKKWHKNSKNKKKFLENMKKPERIKKIIDTMNKIEFKEKHKIIVKEALNKLEVREKMKKPRSEESKKNMRKPKSKEHCENIRKSRLGKHHSEETLQKLRKPKSEETKIKISMRNTGKVRSKEVKNYMSKSRLGVKRGSYNKKMKG